VDLIDPALPALMPTLATTSTCMQRLDRLGWAAGTCGMAHGVRIGVRVSDARLLEELPRYLPPGWRPLRRPRVERLFSLVAGGGTAGGPVRRMNLLYSGVVRRARTLDRQAMLGALASDIRFTIAVAAPRRVFVHAGVVEWRGRALLLPGQSCSGKSTLVAALLRAGARYYSDEFAVLDAHGRVHPFAKPLSLRRTGGVDETPPEALGSRAGTRPLPVGLVVFSHYRAGARWRTRSLTRGQAVLELLRHTGPARKRPAEAMACLGRVVAGAAALRGVRGEADEAANALLRLVETARPA
jgi:hypothetical protein